MTDHPSHDDHHIALLRGVNVGGRHRLPMGELVAIFEHAGATGVRTYIQSGNVVFRARPERVPELATRVAGAILDSYGFTSPVITRTAARLRAVVGANPFLARGCDPRQLHVGFLADPPAPERVAAFDCDRSPPDEAVVAGDEVYLHFPNGVSRTRFTSAYLDATLGTVVTVRNWRTTLALLELVS